MGDLGVGVSGLEASGVPRHLMRFGSCGGVVQGRRVPGNLGEP